MVNAKRVGFFIPKGNKYCREVQEGINAFCQIQRWKLVLAEGAEKDVFRHLADHLDGVIAGVENPEFASILQAWGKPCVDVLNRMPNWKFPRVHIDLQAIGRLGAEHLMSLGFKQFAFCGHKQLWFSQARQKAFEEAVQQAGGTCIVHLMETHTLDWPSIWHSVADWAAKLPKPIGLLAAKDPAGLEVLEACRSLGIRVPEQVAVLGIGNDIQLCQRATPPLSSIDLGLPRIGFKAASLLEEMMAGKPVPNRTILFPPVGVVCRSSTDAQSLEDPQMTAVLRYIRDHACDPMQINDLLAIVPLSRRSLEMRFFQARGRSLHEEIRRIQLQRATRLLAQTKMPLDQVAQASGFGSAVWLVKVFRKELGVTPGEHRRHQGQVAMAPPSC